MVVFALAGLQLVPDGTLLVHIALILIMIFILNRTFLRPINRIIETRDKNRGGKFGAAGDILRRVEEKSAILETEMRQARSEGYNLIEAERENAAAEYRTRVETVKSEVAQRMESEKSEISRQTEEARGQITAEARVLAEKISAGILKS